MICQKYCHCITIFILYIRFMIPLLWRNYTIISEIHSYCPSIIIYNSRIMIIFFIWNLFIIGLNHGFSSSIFIFFRIFILFVPPFFWNLNFIIPKIITNCIIIKIFNIRIMLILFIRYLSIYSLYHSISLSLIISISPFFWYF